MSEEKKETTNDIIDEMMKDGDDVLESYANRLKKSLELKGENIDDDRELVTELWRSGNNIGARFTFKKKDIMWQDMTVEQRQECVQNMAQMAQFFNQFISQTERPV